MLEVGRLALRVEGKNWNAYWAPMHTMVGAVYLGSIKMRLIEAHPPLKDKFMELMKEAMTVVIEDVDGAQVEDWKTKPAPAHERTEQ